MGIRGHVHTPESAGGGVPVLVFMHGFKGFQGWGPWGAICDRFAANGVAAVRFDLSHNGVGDDGVAFSALDRFERNTIDAELHDLGAVLDWLGSGPDLPVSLDVARTVLFGHSRGGGGILLGAAERLGLSPAAPEGTGGRTPDPIGLRGLVTWAAIATYERGWAVEAIERWERGESVPVWNKRTEQMMPLGPQLYRDYLARPERYDIEAATVRLGAAGLPLLLVHCVEDETVPVGEVGRLRDAYFEGAVGPGAATPEGAAPGLPAVDVTVEEVPGGDHTFGTKHPFAGWTPALEAAFGHTLRFVRRVVT